MSTRGRGHDHAVLGALGWQVGRPGSRVRRRGQQGAPAAGAVRLFKELHLQKKGDNVNVVKSRYLTMQGAERDQTEVLQEGKSAQYSNFIRNYTLNLRSQLTSIGYRAF